MAMDEDLQAVNEFAWIAVSTFCAGGAAVYLADRYRQRRGGKNATATPFIPMWASVMLVASYAFIIPGLFFHVFGYEVSAMKRTLILQHSEKNQVGFAIQLAEAGGYTGAFIILFYCAVIPAMKIVMLVAALFLRKGGEKQVAWARALVITLQFVSKWASPDMFAYVLLVYLVRGFEHPPLLGGQASLDIGWTGYAIFCVFSTIASQAIQVPRFLHEREQESKEGSREGLGSETKSAGQRTETDSELTSSQGSSLDVSQGSEVDLARIRGSGARSGADGSRRHLLRLILVAMLSLAFVLFFVKGILLPCLALRLDVDGLFEPKGDLSLSLKPVVDSLHLDNLVKDDVSIWRAVVRLGEWAVEGEANSLIAFLLFVIFVFLFTVLDMAVLLGIAVQAYVHGFVDDGDEASFTSRGLRLSRMLKKLSMLDVLVAGLVIVTLAGKVYEEEGVHLMLRKGSLVLFLAELFHYVAYYIIQGSATGSSEARELHSSASSWKSADTDGVGKDAADQV